MPLDAPTPGSNGRAILSVPGRIVLTLAVICAVVWAPIRYWPFHLSAAIVVYLGYLRAGVSITRFERRLLIALPLLLAFAAGIPLTRGFDAGWPIMAGVLVKSTIAIATLVLLSECTPAPELLRGLRTLGVPKLLVAILGLMLRYLHVFTDELSRMRRAKESRTFRRSLASECRGLPNLAAILFIRSVDRSTRIHQAMLARGWTGEMHSLSDKGH